MSRAVSPSVGRSYGLARVPVLGDTQSHAVAAPEGGGAHDQAPPWSRRPL